MKNLLFFLLLLPVAAMAQYQNAPNKLRLGIQTTGDGLIFRGDSIPSFTPTSNANAWFFLDTAAQVLYTHIGGTWVSLADTITSGGTVTLSGEVVGESNATKLDTVDRVIFDPTNGGADSTYKLTYNANDFTLHFGMGLGGEVYQMGQELYYPPCINKTASTIYAGQPVMIDTSGIIQGDRLAVMPAFANGLPANYIVGVAAHDIAPDAEGLVTWFGYVREVDESDIAASGVTLDVGDILYLSATPGKYSDTEPAAPAINSTIALVVRKPSANNITLLVRPWLNEKLGELTDVDLSGIADGDALVWDSISGTWQTAPKQDPLTGTGLVKSTGGTISYVTDNSADWNAAYNDRITGAAFTGSTTKTLTLTQQDAGTVTANFTDLQGVTSVATGVGLSGGTITSSGTISADTTVLASKTWTQTRGYLTSEVDGSVTNEGSLTVGAGSGTTSVINSNTSGSTGVTISASTGLSISEAGNTITLTNSAPDQTVSLTGAGITSISGTYPSFTITSTEVDGSTSNELQNLTLSGQSLGITSGSGVTLPVVGITAGTGISSSSASGDFTITNSAPEATSARNINATGEGVYRDEVSNELQFKKLVAGSNITLTGADSTITIASTAGGTGTVTSITAGTGLTGGTITTSGTIAADTSLISTKDFAKYQSPIIGLQNTVGNNFLFGRPQQKDTILYRGDGGVSIYDYETTTFNSNNKVVYGIALTGQALALHNLSTNGIISRTGAGTVAARTLTAGTGISISNGDGVSANPTITNSAPDQTVSITGAGINSVSGTYPNFTITGTEVDGSLSNEGSLTVGAGASNTSIINSNTSGSTGVTIEASTGLTIAESGSTITLTNSAPDQTVSISGAGINSVSGTYPNFTITGTEVDGSTTNELQNLSLTGQTLGISSGSGVTLPVVGITAGTGISTTSASGDFTITNSAPEATTARNVNATGEGVFRDEVGNELQFKKLVAGSNITLTGADSTVTIAASGGGTGTVTSITAGTGLTGGTITTSGTIAADTSVLSTKYYAERQSPFFAISDNAFGPITSFIGGQSTPIRPMAKDTIYFYPIDSSIQLSTGSLTFSSDNNGEVAIGVNSSYIATVARLADTASTLRALIPTDAIIGARNVNPTGEGVFRDEVGNELEFKKLVAGSNITLTGADSTITIAGNAGTVTSIATNNGITGGTITDSGTIGLTGNALALHQLATNGIIARTGISTLATRSITAGTGISVSNGDGVSGNPTISVDTATIATVSAVRDTASTLRGLIAAAGGDFGTVAANKVAFGAASGDTLTSNTNLHWDNNNGRLGIGSTNPLSALHVQSSVNTQLSLRNTGATNGLNIGVSADRFITITKPAGTVNVDNYLYEFSVIGGADSINPFWSGIQFAGHRIDKTAETAYPRLTMFSRSSSVWNPSDYEMVFGLGNMGTFSGGVSFRTHDNNASFLRFGTDSSPNNFYVKGDGNVGIGTASPSSILSLNGNSARTIGTERHTTAGQAGNNLTIKVGGAASGATDAAGGNLILESGVSTGTGSSNIIFETAAEGSSGTTDRTPAERMRITGSAVGILNTSPDSALTVTGGANFSSTVLAKRLKINTSGQAIEINNYYPSGTNGLNFFIGNGGANMIGSGDSPSRNFGIGNNALLDITSGNNNIAFGDDAGQNITTGVANILIGSNAGENLTGGNGNTVVGINALDASNVNYNTAIGTGVLTTLNSTSIGENTAIGYNSLNPLFSGSKNVALGYDAGRLSNSGSNMTANSNGIFIGHDARSNTTSSSNEVVIGYQGRGNGSNTVTIGNSSTTNNYFNGVIRTTSTIMQTAGVLTVTTASANLNTSPNNTYAYVIVNYAGTCTLTLPTAGNWTGREIKVKTITANIVKSADSNVLPIDDTTASDAILPATDGKWATLVSDGTNWIIMQAN